MRRAFLVLAAALALAGCDTSRDPGGVSPSDLLRDRLKSIGRPASAPAGLPSDAVLAARKDPLLLVEIPSRGARATLSPAARNAGTVTWLSRDGITVTTRDGLIVATRGLGPDLMSADVGAVRTALTSGGSAARVHYTLSGENRTVAQRFDCQLTPTGSETLTITGRRFPSRMIEESCAGGGQSFTNRYWVSQGRVIRSQQWLTPGIGALSTRLLAD